jgi:hypothetical protein
LSISSFGVHVVRSRSCHSRQGYHHACHRSDHRGTTTLPFHSSPLLFSKSLSVWQSKSPPVRQKRRSQKASLPQIDSSQSWRSHERRRNRGGILCLKRFLFLVSLLFQFWRGREGVHQFCLKRSLLVFNCPIMVRQQKRHLTLDVFMQQSNHGPTTTKTYN